MNQKRIAGTINYKNLNDSENWWQDFYAPMDLNNIRNIFVYSYSKSSKTIIDQKKHYLDASEFFLTNFFNESDTCYGLMLINSEGEYLLKHGEYSQKEVDAMIKQIGS